jgi:hypothetical protein
VGIGNKFIVLPKDAEISKFEKKMINIFFKAISNIEAQ